MFFVMRSGRKIQQLHHESTALKVFVVPMHYATNTISPSLYLYLTSVNHLSQGTDEAKAKSCLKPKISSH